MPILFRPLGNSGIEVAPLALGGNVFGWTVDQATGFALLDAFVEGGFNLIDTADVYSRWVPGNQGGESEALLGQWLRRSGKRARVVIATKVGGEMAPGEKGLSRAHIVRAVEASLRRLQTDHVDLYQSHFDDPAMPQEETLEAFAGLVAAGKVRAIGASNFEPARLTAALQLSRQRQLPAYQSLQPLYNLYDRAPFEAELAGVCRREGLAVLPYYALASGFLSGKYRGETDLDQSPRGAGVKKYLNPRGFRILAALDAVAAARGAKVAQVALAWLMAQPGVTAPIASATSLEQLGELMGAARLRLDPAELAALTAASADG